MIYVVWNVIDGVVFGHGCGLVGGQILFCTTTQKKRRGNF
jgi:hypothetical protein